MATQADIDAAIAEAAAAGIKAGEINFSAGELLERVNEMPELEQRASSNAEDMVTIYSTKDGLPSTIPTYMLGKHLRARWQQRHVRDDRIPPSLVGKAVWSLAPTKEYQYGTNKCYLHPESPMRPVADQAGLAGIECYKTGLRTELDVRRHMQHKHRDEWDAIEQYTGDSKQESRDRTLEDLLKRLVGREDEEPRPTPTRSRK